MLAAAQRGEPHEQSLADAAFHGAIVRGSRNTTLERQWTFLEPYSRTYITLSRPGADLVALAEEHLPILEALRAGDGKRAGRAMHRHLMHAAKPAAQRGRRRRAPAARAPRPRRPARGRAARRA